MDRKSVWDRLLSPVYTVGWRTGDPRLHVTYEGRRTNPEYSVEPARSYLYSVLLENSLYGTVKKL